MVADAHRSAADELEQAIADLGDPATKPYIGRTVIENYYGAAFHWIAYGCERKHGKHKENHSGLVSYLRALGELTTATRWHDLEDLRNGGWYGHRNSIAEIQEAQRDWQEIRQWALT